MIGKIAWVSVTGHNSLALGINRTRAAPDFSIFYGMSSHKCAPNKNIHTYACLFVGAHVLGHCIQARSEARAVHRGPAY